MLKVMVMTDNPSLPTGMARVGREIALALHGAGHEVVYLGWYKNPPSPKPFPFKVIACENRFFGSDVFDRVWKDEQFDLLITVGDMWRLDYLTDTKRCRSRRFFQWIAYTAIDGQALTGGLPKYLHPAFNNPDKVIAYTQFGKDVIAKSIPELEEHLEVIYHGVDPKVFYPVGEGERAGLRRKFNMTGKFVFLVVSRNQGRKNIPEIFKAWRLVSNDQTMNDAVLWPHMNFDSEPMGISISQLLETYGFSEMNKRNVMYVQKIAQGDSGINLPPDAFLNELYNAADCLVMAGSEGFGLPCLEAMASKTPVIALDHSATGELCAEGRGLLAQVAYSITGMYMHERPYPDIESLYEAMRKIYHNAELRKSITEKAYRFALQHSWAKKAEAWLKVIQQIEYPLSDKVRLTEVA